MTQPPQTGPVGPLFQPVAANSSMTNPGLAIPGADPATFGPPQHAPAHPGHQPGAPTKKRNPILAIAAGVLATALAVVSVLLIQANGDLKKANGDLKKSESTVSTLKGDLADLQAEVVDLAAQVKGYEDEAAAAAAEAAEVPDLFAILSKHAPQLPGLAGTPDFVTFSLPNTVTSDQLTGLPTALEEMGFNAGGVLSQMSVTRAIDGTQTATGKNCTASWTYHPDAGLNVVIQTTKP